MSNLLQDRLSRNTIDKVGISYIDPINLIYLKLCIAAICLTPYMILKKHLTVVEEWRVNKPKISIISILLTMAYFLVLVAMTTSKVSYVSAVREMSIVFVSIIGSVYLHEKFVERKILGSVLIFIGIILITISK